VFAFAKSVQIASKARSLPLKGLPVSCSTWAGSGLHMVDRCQLHQYFTSSFFYMKVLCAAFMCLQFGFVIFWRKDYGAKAAHKCWWNWHQVGKACQVLDSSLFGLFVSEKEIKENTFKNIYYRYQCYFNSFLCIWFSLKNKLNRLSPAA